MRVGVAVSQAGWEYAGGARSRGSKVQSKGQKGVSVERRGNAFARARERQRIGGRQCTGGRARPEGHTSGGAWGQGVCARANKAARGCVCRGAQSAECGMAMEHESKACP